MWLTGLTTKTAVHCLAICLLTNSDFTNQKEEFLLRTKTLYNASNRISHYSVQFSVPSAKIYRQKSELIMANKKIAHKILLKMLSHTATILNKSYFTWILLTL